MQALKRFVSENKHLLIVLLMFLLLEIINLAKPRGILWDEAVYIGIGKYIYSLGSVGLFESFRPMAIPLINGLFWRLGLDPFVYGQAFSVICSLIFIIVTYIIAKHLFGKRSAFFASMVLAISPVFIQNSSLVLTDIPSAIVMLLAVYAFFREKVFLSGLLSALAIVFKFPHLLLPMVFPATILIWSAMKRRFQYKMLLDYVLGFIICISPYLIFNYFSYIGDAGVWWHAVLRPFIFAQQAISQDVIWTQGTGFLYYAKQLFLHNYLILFGAAGFGAYLARKDFKKLNYLLLSVLTIIYLAYFNIQTHKEYRYAVIFLPMLAIFAGHGFDIALRHKRWIRGAAMVILLLALINAINLDITQKYQFPNTMEFYKQNMPSGSKVILTSDPVPAAIFDKRFIPYYFDPFVGNKIYDKEISNSDTVIFTKQAFYCASKDCEDALNLLSEKTYKNKLIAEQTIDGQKTAILTTMLSNRQT